MVTAEAIAEPIPQRSDVTKAVRNVFNRHLAHEGIMLDRMQRQLRNAEKLQRFAATGKIDDLPKPDEDEDMGVNIGNEYHLHQIMQPSEQQPVAQPASTTAANPVTTAVVATQRKLWPVVLAAALSGGAVGSIPLVYQWLHPQATPQVKLPDYQLQLQVQDHP